MQNRRNFFKTTAAAASIAALGSIPGAFAAVTTPITYTNIVYTKDSPGQWASKVGSHLPQVTVTGTKVDVVTKHPMSNEHFIVRHTLVLEDGTFIGATTFVSTDKPESTYELPSGYKGKIYVTSFCNKHDFWLAETII